MAVCGWSYKTETEEVMIATLNAKCSTGEKFHVFWASWSNRETFTLENGTKILLSFKQCKCNTVKLFHWNTNVHMQYVKLFHCETFCFEIFFWSLIPYTNLTAKSKVAPMHSFNSKYKQCMHGTAVMPLSI